jgi:hypothetical protein
MPVSKKKIFRDIIIIVVLAAVVIAVWVFNQKAHKTTQKSSPAADVAFSPDSVVEVLMIDGNPVTLGELDKHAQKAFQMNGLDESTLNKELLMVYRVDAISRIIQDYINRVAIGEFNIVITKEEIDKELEEAYNIHGGKDKFETMMKSRGQEEDAFARLIERDITSRKILENVTANLSLPDDEQAASDMRMQAYYAWMTKKASDLNVEILDAELKHAYEMATDPHSQNVVDSVIPDKMKKQLMDNSDEEKPQDNPAVDESSSEKPENSGK